MTDEHRETGVGWPDEPGAAAAPETVTPRAASPDAAAPSPEELPPEESPAGERDAGERVPQRPEPVASGGSRPRGPRPAPEPDGLSEVDAPAEADPDAPAEPDAAAEPEAAPEDRRRPSAAGVMIGLLLALLGFAIAVQFKNVSTDPTLAAARQEDLVRILSDLEAREERLRADIAELEESQRQLNSGAQGRQAALEEARRRADDLGILAGTLPARGPGLHVHFGGPVKARAILDAVQELRGAGAEAMQISGGDGPAIRIVASSYFLDADGGITVDGRRITSPYTLRVIGDSETMRTALHIAGGVVESVAKDGGTVTDEPVTLVEVTALREPSAMQFARPVS